MDECLELRNSTFASVESLKKLRLKLEALSSDSEERLKKPIYRSSTFITPTPLGSRQISETPGIGAVKVI